MDRIDLLAKYWEGPTNKLARGWMYIRMANSAMNEFRSYGYMVVGIYIGTPYLQNHLLQAFFVLAGIISISIPLMIIFGRWLLYRANPAMEYANKVKGSPYQYKVEDATIATEEHLREIKAIFKNDKNFQ